MSRGEEKKRRLKAPFSCDRARMPCYQTTILKQSGFLQGKTGTLVGNRQEDYPGYYQ
jgi:hypothetical protein